MNAASPSSPPRRQQASSPEIFTLPALTIGVVAARVVGSDAIAWVRSELQLELERTTAKGHAGRALTALTNASEHELAEAVLAAGFSLEAVVPSRAFASTLEDNERTSFESLLKRTADQTILTYEKPTDAAFEAASRFIVYYSDTVVVVLDEEDERRGWSKAVLDYARDHKRRVLVLDPTKKTTVRAD